MKGEGVGVRVRARARATVKAEGGGRGLKAEAEGRGLRKGLGVRVRSPRRRAPLDGVLLGLALLLPVDAREHRGGLDRVGVRPEALLAYSEALDKELLRLGVLALGLGKRRQVMERLARPVAHARVVALTDLEGSKVQPLCVVELPLLVHEQVTEQMV